MRLLVLMLLLGVVTWFYFPETRSIMLDVAEPVVTPVVRWSTTEEMSQVARNVLEHERLTGQLPSGSEWLGWLQYRYPSDDLRTDPWGTTYQLEVSRDSVWVLSFGPDRTRQTDDDFRVAAPRR